MFDGRDVVGEALPRVAHAIGDRVVRFELDVLEVPLSSRVRAAVPGDQLRPRPSTRGDPPLAKDRRHRAGPTDDDGEPIGASRAPLSLPLRTSSLQLPSPAYAGPAESCETLIYEYTC